MSRAFQEARDFVGADWETLRQDSRAKLLNTSNVPDSLSALPWKRLPPSVKASLARVVMKDKNK
jgi:hypothetical protein